MARHAKGKGGRHARQPEPYQGWGPVQTQPLDEADQLAMSWTNTDTPPMPWAPPRFAPAPVPVQPRFAPAPVPVQPRPFPWDRVVVPIVTALSVLVVALVGIIMLAISMDPQKAQADAAVAAVARPPQTQTVIVIGDRIKVKARELCPTEDSCDINYEGQGTWTITRVVP